jgi:hypothetical protein
MSRIHNSAIKHRFFFPLYVQLLYLVEYMEGEALNSQPQPGILRTRLLGKQGPQLLLRVQRVDQLAGYVVVPEHTSQLIKTVSKTGRKFGRITQNARKIFFQVRGVCHYVCTQPPPLYTSTKGR